MEIRLQKAIAQSGLTSRRNAEEWISEGLVKVNGKKVSTQGILVDPQKDKILVKGKRIPPPLPINRVFAFYKPKSCVSSLKDPEGRDSIANYLPKIKGRVFPTGRLDYDAEGLILLTNDGDLAYSIMHPKSHVWKTYFVKIKGTFPNELLGKLRKGPTIERVKRQPVKVKVIHRINDKTWMEVSLQEGIQHHIKKMFAELDFRVLKIKRFSISNITLENLKPGENRELTEKEKNELILSVQGKQSKKGERG